MLFPNWQVATLLRDIAGLRCLSGGGGAVLLREKPFKVFMESQHFSFSSPPLLIFSVQLKMVSTRSEKLLKSFYAFQPVSSVFPKLPLIIPTWVFFCAFFFPSFFCCATRNSGIIFNTMKEEGGTWRFLLLENASKVQTGQRAEERVRAPANTTVCEPPPLPAANKEEAGTEYTSPNKLQPQATQDNAQSLVQ